MHPERRRKKTLVLVSVRDRAYRCPPVYGRLTTWHRNRPPGTTECESVRRKPVTYRAAVFLLHEKSGVWAEELSRAELGGGGTRDVTLAFAREGTV